MQPGGIDVQGIIGSATALLASLLAGDDNFGKVLGAIVGKMIKSNGIRWIAFTEQRENQFKYCSTFHTGNAIDGFSGGGGAVNPKRIHSLEHLIL